MTKEQAIEISRNMVGSTEARSQRRFLIEALASASAFTDGATVRDAAIEEVASAFVSMPAVAAAIRDLKGQPSRPVATEAGAKRAHRGDNAHGMVCLDCGAKYPEALDECPGRPVATGSKAQAEEVLHSLNTEGLEYGSVFVEALDRAKFFADEATLAEIDEALREIERLSEAGAPFAPWATVRSLATAARKLVPVRGTR